MLDFTENRSELRQLIGRIAKLPHELVCLIQDSLLIQYGRNPSTTHAWHFSRIIPEHTAGLRNRLIGHARRNRFPSALSVATVCHDRELLSVAIWPKESGKHCSPLDFIPYHPVVYGGFIHGGPDGGKDPFPPEGRQSHRSLMAQALLAGNNGALVEFVAYIRRMKRQLNTLPLGAQLALIDGLRVAIVQEHWMLPELLATDCIGLASQCINGLRLHSISPTAIRLLLPVILRQTEYCLVPDRFLSRMLYAGFSLTPLELVRRLVTMLEIYRKLGLAFTNATILWITHSDLDYNTMALVFGQSLIDSFSQPINAIPSQQAKGWPSRLVVSVAQWEQRLHKSNQRYLCVKGSWIQAGHPPPSGIAYENISWPPSQSATPRLYWDYLL